MAYKSWGSASWSTSNADGLFVGGNHVVLVVASVAVPNQLSLLRMAAAAAAPAPAPAVVVAGAAIVAALIVAVVGSAEVVVVGLVEDAEEGLEIAEEGLEIEGLETAVAVVSEVEETAAAAEASEEVGMTLVDHREVEVATGSCFAE